MSPESLQRAEQLLDKANGLLAKHNHPETAVVCHRTDFALLVGLAEIAVEAARLNAGPILKGKTATVRNPGDYSLVVIAAKDGDAEEVRVLPAPTSALLLDVLTEVLDLAEVLKEPAWD